MFFSLFLPVKRVMLRQNSTEGFPEVHIVDRRADDAFPVGPEPDPAEEAMDRLPTPREIKDVLDRDDS